jgi:hypothetical protein
MDKRIIKKILIIVLWLTAFHSFLVGLLLMLLPSETIEFFGFDANNHSFFRVQAGVFHIVLSIFYVIAARNTDKQKTLIKLIISTKFIATLFLVSYYLFVSAILTVFLSGIGDFLIGLCILILFTLNSKPAKTDITST